MAFTSLCPSASRLLERFDSLGGVLRLVFLRLHRVDAQRIAAGDLKNPTPILARTLADLLLGNARRLAVLADPAHASINSMWPLMSFGAALTYSRRSRTHSSKPFRAVALSPRAWAVAADM